MVQHAGSHGAWNVLLCLLTLRLTIWVAFDQQMSEIRHNQKLVEFYVFGFSLLSFCHWHEKNKSIIDSFWVLETLLKWLKFFTKYKDVDSWNICATFTIAWLQMWSLKYKRNNSEQVASWWEKWKKEIFTNYGSTK